MQEDTLRLRSEREELRNKIKVAQKQIQKRAQYSEEQRSHKRARGPDRSPGSSHSSPSIAAEPDAHGSEQHAMHRREDPFAAVVSSGVNMQAALANASGAAESLIHVGLSCKDIAALDRSVRIVTIFAYCVSYNNKGFCEIPNVHSDMKCFSIVQSSP